ncbi:MAG: peptide deformylase [Clostridiales bacterium]|nr:peptide deformylase [Candidatus Crickella merdequi]
MIKPIVKDPMFLARKAAPATPADIQTARNLLETLASKRETCVGMAANMIGEAKSIIAVADGGAFLVMFNPVIIAKSEPYETEEGCLSLNGERKTTRYNKITVEFDNMQFRHMKTEYTGFTAQIIQHEVDHCNGIVI